MKKKLCFFVLFISIIIHLNAQLIIKIDSIFLSGLIEAREKNVIASHFGDGPHISGYISIENISDTNFVFDNNTVTIFLESQKANGEKYSCFFSSIEKDDKTGITIKPNQTYQIHDVSAMQLYKKETEYANCCVIDHNPELLDVLSNMELVLFVNDNEVFRCAVNAKSNVIIDNLLFETVW